MASLTIVVSRVLAVCATAVLAAAIAVQATPRECLVPARLDDVAGRVWTLPHVPVSGHSSAGGLMCTDAEERAFGPLSIREECSKCSGPPDSWCEGGTLTVWVRPSSALCPAGAPWTTPAAAGRRLLGSAYVLADAERGPFVVLARRPYFDGDSWLPYRIALPPNPLYEPMSDWRAVTFGTERLRNFRGWPDALALVLIAASLGLGRLARGGGRAFAMGALAAGAAAFVPSLYVLVLAL